MSYRSSAKWCARMTALLNCLIATGSLISVKSGTPVTFSPGLFVLFVRGSVNPSSCTTRAACL
eukprot:2017739-Prorocentrum_lima.AAC.1